MGPSICDKALQPMPHPPHPLEFQILLKSGVLSDIENDVKLIKNHDPGQGLELIARLENEEILTQFSDAEDK